MISDCFFKTPPAPVVYLSCGHMAVALAGSAARICGPASGPASNKPPDHPELRGDLQLTPIYLFIYFFALKVQTAAAF